MYNTFKIFDYILFCLSLCIPLFISLYVGCYKNKRKTAKEYLYGNENQHLNAWSVGLSLFSGCISSLAILGPVAEVYLFGPQFMLASLGVLTSIVVIWYFILPVYCGNLDLQTPYEYFEYRFDTKIRVMVTILELIHSISFMSVVLYASTVSFSQITNTPLVLCTTVVGLICTIYTLIGGFVGVIWTDVIQSSFMFFSCIFVMIKGVNVSNGFSNVFSIAEEGQRMQFFNFDPNPFVRLSFWSTVIGMCFLFTAYAGASAKALQRFMAVGNEKSARITTVISASCYAVILIISGITGLCAYAFYRNCDPITNKQISSPNHLLPLFITDIAGYIPGFVGFFSAGLISAGLSTISADMNVLSGLIYYDILQKMFKTNTWKIPDTFVMKIIIFLYGIVIIILAPLVAKSKHVYQVVLSIGSLPYGAIVGVTILGTSFPKVNAKGTLCGVIASLALLVWISYKQLTLDISSGYLLPVSVQNCTIVSINYTDITSTISKAITERCDGNDNEPFILYKLSFMYYTVFGILITMLVAVFISYITGFNDVNKMNPNLIIPWLRSQKKTVNQDEAIKL